MDSLFRFSDEQVLGKAHHHLTRYSKRLLSKELTGKSTNFALPDPERLNIDSEDHFSQANAVRR
jgi:hypothetical protein